MKSWNALSSQRKVFIIACSLATLGFWAFDQQMEDTQDAYTTIPENMNYPANEDPAYSQGAAASYQTQYAGAPTSDGYKKVEIYDKGLQMPISTVTIPQDWNLSQDIAIDPNTNETARYHFEIAGPNGEIIRFLGSDKYGAMAGISFSQGFQKMLSGIQLEQLQVGNMEQDLQAQEKLMKLKVYQRLVSNGNLAQCMKAPVSGYLNGQRYQGYVYVTKIGNEIGSLSVNSAIAPAEQVGSLMKVKENIDQSYAPNPAYEQRREQIQQYVSQQFQNFHNQQMANSQAAHQQRMADRQAAFNAHQQRMGQMSQIQDQSFNSYMDGLRNSNSYNSGTGYSSNDAFIDQIHERSTFNDPWSEQEMHLDGQYDYNYTNGLGDYYRTDDPSFDPNSLQGDWQQIDPEYPY